MRAAVLALVLFAGALPAAEAAEPQHVETRLAFPADDVARLHVTITYDAARYRVGSFRLPPGFHPEDVEDDCGDIDHEVDRDEARGDLVEFEVDCEGEIQIVAVKDPAATDRVLGAGAYFSTVHALAYDGWEAELVVTAPPDGVLLVPTPDGVRRLEDRDTWRRDHEEIVSATYLVLTEGALAEHEVVDVGHYVVVRPRAWSDEAKARADEALRAADAFVPGLERMSGLAAPFSGEFLVVFGPDSLFREEHGFYSEGVIALHASAFEDAPDGWLLRESRTLVHETYHAFLGQYRWLSTDARWLNEGAARHAELRFEASRPDLLARCEEGTCVNDTARGDLSDLERHYADAPEVPDWIEASGLTAAEYERAGYVVEAYVDAHGESRYRTMIKTLRAMRRGCDLACAVERDLFPGVDSTTDLLYPHLAAWEANASAFAAAVAPFVEQDRFWDDPAWAPPVDETPAEPSDETPPREAPGEDPSDGPPTFEPVVAEAAPARTPTPWPLAMAAAALAALLRRR